MTIHKFIFYDNAIFMIIVIVVLMPTNYNYLDMLAFDIPFDCISNSYAS